MASPSVLSGLGDTGERYVPGAGEGDWKASRPNVIFPMPLAIPLTVALRVPGGVVWLCGREPDSLPIIARFDSLEDTDGVDVSGGLAAEIDDRS